MKKILVTLSLTLLISACGSEEVVVQEPSSPPSPTEITWESTGFAHAVGGDVYNVTDLLVLNDGSVLATYYNEAHESYIAYSEDQGSTWTTNELPQVQNPRALRQLSDGTFLLGTTSTEKAPILFSSEDGLQWKALETTGLSLPNRESSIVWDILELSDGRVLLATDDSENDPDKTHPTLYFLDGNELSVAGEFPGIGILSLEQDSEGNLYLATEESDEHDDPALAGQAHIFKSSDNGESWEEVGLPEGANRVYDMLASSDGSLYLGTGISGDLFRSQNGGENWEKMTHVPSSEKLWGNPPSLTEMDATRIYQILELSNGDLLVGTGNKTGDIYLTQDGGETWLSTSETGPNIVIWGLAQDPKTGLLWAGTGSHGGDIFTATWAY